MMHPTWVQWQYGILILLTVANRPPTFFSRFLGGLGNQSQFKDVLKRDSEHIMSFAPALYKVRDEDFNREWLLVEGVAHFVGEENMQAFTSPARAGSEWLHWNGYLCCIVTQGNVDVNLLHDVCIVLVER